jgi:hypothetical protein
MKKPDSLEQGPQASPQSQPASAEVERRRHPRHPERRPAWLFRGSTSSAVEMIDISAGGACFLSSRALPLGKALRLQVGHGSTQITLDGTVVRLVQRNDAQYEIAIRLDEMLGFEVSQRFPSRGRLAKR